VKKYYLVSQNCYQIGVLLIGYATWQSKRQLVCK